MNSKEYS